jgi:membrane protein implicated in regulation of membrane protease activity
MAIQFWWWVLAVGIGILELLSGTFYLLVIAAGCGAAGVLAALGGPLWTQFAAAAVVCVAGTAWARRARAGAPRPAPAGQNADVIADIGQRVHVRAWDVDGPTRVQYRGTQWTVELAPGEVAEPGEYRISEVAGNRLILTRP